MKAYTYKEYADHSLTVGEIPADMLDKSKRLVLFSLRKPFLLMKVDE